MNRTLTVALYVVVVLLGVYGGLGMFREGRELYRDSTFLRVARYQAMQQAQQKQQQKAAPKPVEPVEAK